MPVPANPPDFRDAAVAQSERLLAEAQRRRGEPIKDPAQAGISYCLRAPVKYRARRELIVSLTLLAIPCLAIAGYIVREFRPLNPSHADRLLLIVAGAFLTHAFILWGMLRVRASLSSRVVARWKYMGQELPQEWMRVELRDAAEITTGRPGEQALMLFRPGFLQLETRDHRLGVRPDDLVSLDFHEPNTTVLAYRVGDTVLRLAIKRLPYRSQPLDAERVIHRRIMTCLTSPVPGPREVAVKESQRLLALAAASAGKPLAPAQAGISYCLPVTEDMTSVRRWLRAMSIATVVGGFLAFLGIQLIGGRSPMNTLKVIVVSTLVATGAPMLFFGILRREALLRRTVRERLEGDDPTTASNFAAVLIRSSKPPSDPRDTEEAIAYIHPDFLQLEGLAYRHGVRRSDVVSLESFKVGATNLCYRVGDAVYSLTLTVTTPALHAILEACLAPKEENQPDLVTLVVAESQRLLGHAASEGGLPTLDQAGGSYVLPVEDHPEEQRALARMRLSSVLGLAVGLPCLALGFVCLMTIADHLDRGGMADPRMVALIAGSFATGVVFFVGSLLVNIVLTRWLLEGRVSRLGLLSHGETMRVLAAPTVGAAALALIETGSGIAFFHEGYLRIESITHRYGVRRHDLLSLDNPPMSTVVGYRVGSAVFRLTIATPGSVLAEIKKRLLGVPSALHQRVQACLAKADCAA